MAAGKTDHLAGDRHELALDLGFDDDAGADRHGVQRTGHLDHQAAHADHAAVNLVSVQFLDLLEQSPHADGSAGNQFGRRLNPLFTRVVNHYVTVVGIKASLTHIETEGVSRDESVDSRLLKWNMNESVAKKPLLSNILRRFGRNWLAVDCFGELGFVNHAGLTFRISLSQGVFHGPPCGLASLSPQRRRRGLACASC